MIQSLKKHISKLDVVSWILVLLFFGVSTVIFRGILEGALLGAVGIVALMLVITLSIEFILNALRHLKQAGEIAGYITNGPEALCVIVGLLNHKFQFAASVPIGSNFVNPFLLFLAVLIAGRFSSLFRLKVLSGGIVLLVTAVVAGSFYLSTEPAFLWGWAGTALAVSILLYAIKQEENAPDEEPAVQHPALLIPAVLFLVTAGYLLDPVVSYTAFASKLPEGIIGFAVLSFLSSWPEFRSSIALLRMNRLRSAYVNIMVSNITNLWLVIVAILVYLLVYKGSP